MFRTPQVPLPPPPPKKRPDINGSAGIAVHGREEEYATELWLDDPTAFFLHPEGPLSDTTPEEWKAKQVRPKSPAWEFESLARQSAMSGLYQAAMMNSHQSPYSQGYSLLGGLFGGLANTTPLR